MAQGGTARAVSARVDDSAEQHSLVEEALAGLTGRPKTLPAKLFYDDEGCRLFGEITRLPEYYLTRTERVLLASMAPEMGSLVPPGAILVEYGAYDESKALVLLQEMRRPFGYVPIDVAEGALAALAERLARSHPDMLVQPVHADFMQPIQLPSPLEGAPRLGFFPGSTIGNLTPAMATQFLAEVRRTLGPGAQFLVGADLRKPAEILVPAYDDAAGVTAAFNRNILVRLNRDARADFVPECFAHRAVWNEEMGRIEMHLVSTRVQRVRIGGREIAFAEGESIHTENSYKHSVEGFRVLATAAGWRWGRVWTDAAALFSIHLLEAE